MKILVTGTSNGLGKYLLNSLNCYGFNRQINFEDIKKEEYDLIIHCAFNTKNTIPQSYISSYIEDNVFLTKRLVNEVKSNKFIFISSVDIYPKDQEKNEDIDINIDKISNIYGKTKLISEEIVKNHNNFLILRCSGIIGVEKLPKSVVNILQSKKTTLTSTSKVNYITQKTILDIINSNDIKNQVINVASPLSMEIKELETIVNPIEYGTYHYDVGNISIEKLKKHFPKIKNNSSKNNLLDII